LPRGENPELAAKDCSPQRLKTGEILRVTVPLKQYSTLDHEYLEHMNIFVYRNEVNNKIGYNKARRFRGGLRLMTNPDAFPQALKRHWKQRSFRRG
jgi:hypothetical protein